jgi:hypothetical protein
VRHDARPRPGEDPLHQGIERKAAARGEQQQQHQTFLLMDPEEAGDRQHEQQQHREGPERGDVDPHFTQPRRPARQSRIIVATEPLDDGLVQFLRVAFHHLTGDEEEQQSSDDHHQRGAEHGQHLDVEGVDIPADGGRQEFPNCCQPLARFHPASA